MTIKNQPQDGLRVASQEDLVVRYGLMRPPELTPEIASRRWRELNRLIQACMVLHEVGRDRRPFQRLLRSAGTLVGASRGIFLVRCDNESTLELAASSGFVKGVPERLRCANEQAAATLKSGKPILVCRPREARLQEELRWMGEPSCVSFPILREGQSWGVVQLMKGQDFTEDEAVLLWMFALVVEDALPSLVRTARASEIPDAGSTGFISPVAFEAKLDWELECVLWGGRSCTLLRISFAAKRAESSSGVLQQSGVLRAIRQCVRPTDLVSCESSGDLLVLLPETNAAEGQQAAQKIRRSLVQSRVLGEEHAVVPSLRIAQATCPEQGRRREELLRSLDSQT
jgi:hypothetical protein